MPDCDKCGDAELGIRRSCGHAICPECYAFALKWYQEPCYLCFVQQRADSFARLIAKYLDLQKRS